MRRPTVPLNSAAVNSRKSSVGLSDKRMKELVDGCIAEPHRDRLELARQWRVLHKAGLTCRFIAGEYKISETTVQSGIRDPEEWAKLVPGRYKYTVQGRKSGLARR